MKKTMLVVALLIICWTWTITIGANFPVRAAESDVTLLTKAFAATGAVPLGASFHGWRKISDQVLAPDTAVDYVLQMAAEFDLGSDAHVVLRSTGDYSYAVLEQDMENYWLRIQVQFAENITSAAIDVYFSDHENLEQTLNKLTMALDTIPSAGEAAIITSCLEGYLDARLREGDKLDMVCSVFASVQANYGSALDLDGLSIWQGFSPRFSVVGTSSNIVLSFRKQSAQQGTIIRLATPVLPGSY